jgi:hypothetical protein
MNWNEYFMDVLLGVLTAEFDGDELEEGLEAYDRVFGCCTEYDN